MTPKRPRASSRPDKSRRTPTGPLWVFLCLVVAFLLAGCGSGANRKVVVVYTALDEIYSEPILKRFEQRTGLKVEAVYDTEVTKTVGLANRLIAEARNPQCDVFWNNEVVRTVVLKRKGLLQPYASPSARDIPPADKDPDGYWAGFAARARVLIWNTNVAPGGTPAATSIRDFVEPRWKGKVAMAYPIFGTTATQAAALFVAWGDAEAKRYFEQLQQNGVLIVDGNSAVKDAVVRGEVPVGFTDTDDAYVAVSQGKPVRMTFPDQAAGQLGALVIPDTVSLVRNCPHPQAGRQLIDFLLSPEVEGMLARSGSAQMPVRPNVPTPAGIPALASLKAMPVDWERVADKVDEVAVFLGNLFVR
jgi:iron(III) transport system substrate-binding protein